MRGGALVVDGHVDTPLAMLDDGVDIGVPGEATHVDLPRMRSAGLDAAFFAAWVDPAFAPDRAFDRATRLLGAVRAAAAARADRAEFAEDAAGVRTAVAAGRVALLAGVENGQALEGRVENVERLRALGARYLTLTWMNSNELGDAGGGETLHGGLTPLGREVVAEMERVGLLVDLSHAAPSTFDDVLAVARRPVIVSHACTEVRGPHPRNLADDQIRAVAATGGLVGIAFMPGYLDPGHPADVEWTAVVDHLERVIDVAGPAHAALGSDFDGVPRLPRGMAGVQDLPRVVDELERRGCRGAELAMVLGGNWLRVIE